MSGWHENLETLGFVYGISYDMTSGYVSGGIEGAFRSAAGVAIGEIPVLGGALDAALDPDTQSAIAALYRNGKTGQLNEQNADQLSKLMAEGAGDGSSPQPMLTRGDVLYRVFMFSQAPDGSGSVISTASEFYTTDISELKTADYYVPLYDSNGKQTGQYLPWYFNISYNSTIGYSDPPTDLPYVAHPTPENIKFVQSTVIGGVVGKSGASPILNGGSATVSGDYGTISIDADGQYEYKVVNYDGLPAGSHFSDSFVFSSISVNNGKIGTIDILINRAPIVSDVAYFVAAGFYSRNSELPGILAGAVDLDGDMVTVSEINAQGADVGKFIQGKYGTISVRTDGSYDYHANNFYQISRATLGDTVSDKFSINAGDGYGGKSLFNLTFHIKYGEVNRLEGTENDDIFFVDNASDKISEAKGGGADAVITSVSYALAAGQEIEIVQAVSLDDKTNIFITGNELSQTLIGNAGANALNGKGGADTMIGGAGNDTYYIDHTRDRVVESLGGGRDIATTYTSYNLAAGQEIEELRTVDKTAKTTISLTGNEFKNKIVGDAGNNRIDGGGDSDALYGEAGNDTYIVDNVGDRVIEATGGGTDAVATSVSYTLIAGQEIEELRVLSSAGDGPINLTGNAFAQTLKGNGGANRIDGGGGADTMIGGAGNDTYLVDNAGDQVIEATGGGRDAVATGVSYTLAAGQEIEELRVLSSAGDSAIDLTGNSRAQTLIGNGGANVLNGGWGNDVLTGGGGADIFVFANGAGTGNVDRITDFATKDTIQLSKSIFTTLATGELDPTAFKNISVSSVDANDRILYKQSTGELFYDADGTGSGAKVKIAVLDNKAALFANDFLIA